VRLPLDEIDSSSASAVRLREAHLDSVLGGVLLRGQISLLHSPERAPLSFASHLVVVESAITSRDSVSVFIDSGSNYSPQLARSLCNDATAVSDVLSRLVVANVLGLSDLQEVASRLASLGNVGIVVLDSLTGALNLTGAPGTVGRQRALFQVLEVLRSIVNSMNIHLLMTDHSSRNWTQRSA